MFETVRIEEYALAGYHLLHQGNHRLQLVADLDRDRELRLGLLQSAQGKLQWWLLFVDRSLFTIFLFLLLLLFLLLRLFAALDVFENFIEIATVAPLFLTALEQRIFL